MARTSSARTRPAVDLAPVVSTQSKPPPPTSGGLRPHPPLSRRAKTATPTSGATRTPDPAGGGFATLLESAAKEILAVTYWFEPAPIPNPIP